MREKNKLTFSSIALLMATILFCVSVYAWFFSGKATNVIVTTSSADCEVLLFSVDDFNYDGIYDGDFGVEFDVVSTTKNDLIYTSVDSIGDFDFNIIPYGTWEEPEEGETPVGDYIMKPDPFDEEDNHDYGIILRHLPLESENDYVLENMYPSKVFSFALAIRSVNPFHVGSVNFEFVPPDISGNSLAEVISLNAGSFSSLIYMSSYEPGKPISLISSGTGEDDGSEAFVIPQGQTLWVFFSFRFETLDALKTLNPDRFSEFSDLNSFTGKNFSMTTITINYELNDIVAQGD